MVRFPPGRYLLEKTLLIPSKVHIVGFGPSTVFEGARPEDVSGFALIANAGITTERGHDGAKDFSLRNVAIDSPRTNGIVLVHARNAYFANIYGLNSYHHHFDIAGSKNVVCENLFLTGRSGTAPFQIDGSPFYNNTWDGESNVQPIQDGTPNDGIFLSQSVIRPVNRPNHGIHLHRDGGRNIFIDNVLIEHVNNGIYRDADTHRTDVHFSNLVIRDVGNRGIDFAETGNPDRRISFADLVIQNVHGAGFIRYNGCRDLSLRGVKAEAGEETGSQRVVLRNVEGGLVDDVQIDGAGSGSAVWLTGCANVHILNIIARHISRALRLEECGNIRYAGISELREDGTPLDEITIRGGECSYPGTIANVACRASCNLFAGFRLIERFSWAANAAQAGLKFHACPFRREVACDLRGGCRQAAFLRARAAGSTGLDNLDYLW